MNLNSNSFSAKLYKWFYRTNHLPTNFCPYFWKLVMAYPLALLRLVTCFPGMLVFKYIIKDNEVGAGLEFFMTLFTIIVLFVLFTILSPIGLFWYSFKDIGKIIEMGFIFEASILIAFISIKWKDIINFLNIGKKEYKEPTPNIIVEFVKAKYNKYCPQITWK